MPPHDAIGPIVKSRTLEGMILKDLSSSEPTRAISLPSALISRTGKTRIKHEPRFRPTARIVFGAATHPTDAPWRLRYWSIFLGQGFSLVGSSLTQFVLLWWITDTTGSVASLATAGLAALLPQALLGPIGGTLADRYSRRLLMIAADTISALCMTVLIALFLSGAIELWHVYVMMAIRSAMQAFQMPAAVASTAMLVPERFIPRAAGLNQTLTGLILVAAAPLGA